MIQCQEQLQDQDEEEEEQQQQQQQQQQQDQNQEDEDQEDEDQEDEEEQQQQDQEEQQKVLKTKEKKHRNDGYNGYYGYHLHTRQYVLPHYANKKCKYLCPHCLKDIILHQGKNRQFFTHKQFNLCTYYCHEKDKRSIQPQTNQPYYNHSAIQQFRIWFPDTNDVFYNSLFTGISPFYFTIYEAHYIHSSYSSIVFPFAIDSKEYIHKIDVVLYNNYNISYLLCFYNVFLSYEFLENCLHHNITIYYIDSNWILQQPRHIIPTEIKCIEKKI